MPPYPAGSVAEQCAKQYSYLFQMAQQLNMVLEQLDGSQKGGAVQLVQGGAAGAVKAAAERQSLDQLRSLIVRTAEVVKQRVDTMAAKLEGEYVASGEFGTYLQSLSAYLEANPEAVSQYYGFVADLQGDIDGVKETFEHYKVDTEGYIRTGIVYYDGVAPVYGVAVGQNLTTSDAAGETVVEQNNFRAVFTATKLSFWQDSTEVAYISNNRLYITNITVLGALELGNWKLSGNGGLTVRWIGG